MRLYKLTIDSNIQWKTFLKDKSHLLPLVNKLFHILAIKFSVPSANTKFKKSVKR